MSEALTSVGIDVGTTSTQLVFSRLTVGNRGSAFTVPELEIREREILYQSPVYFTPLLGENLVDGEKLRAIVSQEYDAAGIRREAVDTGAIIITGETSRRENARRTLSALSDFAGDFVVATAGPDLESVLAARGAGADDYAAKTGKTVLHMDIGGGTSNLCLIRQGIVEKTGCFNVGGRLVKRDGQGGITYVSPVLEGLWDPGRDTLESLCALLTQTLEMAAGLREKTELLERLATKEAQELLCVEESVVLSFSGGVAECIRRDYDDLAFGDIGPMLGRAIRRSRLCRGEYRLGQQAIRATVIGAGCHATQLSGSTVYAQNVRFPLKNLTVTDGTGVWPEGDFIVSMPGITAPSYAEVSRLADELAVRPLPLRICLEADMAKALGQALAARLPKDAEILCIDRVNAQSGSYLDIGAPVGAAFPVVVKTLAFPAKTSAQTVVQTL